MQIQRFGRFIVNVKPKLEGQVIGEHSFAIALDKPYSNHNIDLVVGNKTYSYKKPDSFQYPEGGSAQEVTDSSLRIKNNRIEKPENITVYEDASQGDFTQDAASIKRYLEAVVTKIFRATPRPRELAPFATMSSANMYMEKAGRPTLIPHDLSFQ